MGIDSILTIEGQTLNLVCTLKLIISPIHIDLTVTGGVTFLPIRR